MIVVMPAGHTSRTALGRGAPPSIGEGGLTPTEEFVKDFVDDVMPYVEKHYRVIADRPHRAIAGLSMGGNQTLNIAFEHLDQFTYVGVFSSGLIGAMGRGAVTAPAAPGAAPAAPAIDESWERDHAAGLDNVAVRKGLKVFWFATGSEDRLMPTTQGTIDLFKRMGSARRSPESAGGSYVGELARLFAHVRPAVVPLTGLKSMGSR
jgi:Predicted esterase